MQRDGGRITGAPPPRYLRLLQLRKHGYNLVDEDWIPADLWAEQLELEAIEYEMGLSSG